MCVRVCVYVCVCVCVYIYVCVCVCVCVCGESAQRWLSRGDTKVNTVCGCSPEWRQLKAPWQMESLSGKKDGSFTASERHPS